MAHPDIPGGHSSEEARQKAEGKGKVDNQFKPKSGITTSNNAPVGTAGNPAVTDASSRGGRAKMTKEKTGAIERRIKRLSGAKKGEK